MILYIFDLAGRSSFDFFDHLSHDIRYLHTYFHCFHLAGERIVVSESKRIFIVNMERNTISPESREILCMIYMEMKRTYEKNKYPQDKLFPFYITTILRKLRRLVWLVEIKRTRCASTLIYDVNYN